MKYIMLLSLLLFGCESLATPPDSSDWNCLDDPEQVHKAFVECVDLMGSNRLSPYSVSQCEDYAHRLFCVSRKAKEAAQIERLKADLDSARKEWAKYKKLSEKYHRQRNVFCATLMGECIMYGVDTKTDRHCEDACVIDDEDVSKEVDKEIAKEKKAEKED